MEEKQVIVELLVEMGVSFQKAAQRLAASTDTPATQVTNVVNEAKEEPKEAAQETAQDGFGLSAMSNKEAMDLVTLTEDEATLRLIGKEEQSRGSKARKGVMKAVQSKLEKLKNPPAQAEVVPEEKSYAVASPAIEAADQVAFMAQFAKLSEAQKGSYFNGEINSIGHSLINQEPTTEPTQGEFEDLGMEAPTSDITAEDLRNKLKAYAKKNGPDKAYAVLAHFGAKKIAELDASKYGEVAAELA